ncbi:MAG: enoyl-CoA hydratase/isomerase family protein [Deltaproteobacteria bacterium]|nr:enoyl-CoA hydratase/isomerase family protein [Deltaproteobacteria bacterium]
MNKYQFFAVERENEQVAFLYLNRPDKLNAMNMPFWEELPVVAEELEADEKLRVVIIAGKGKALSAGIDVFDFFINCSEIIACKDLAAREKMRGLILKMQRGFDVINNGRKIYIFCAHGYCIGAGLDLAAACDIRFASQDVRFSLRETRIGIVADMGSLNRLPQIIGQGNTRLLAFTGKDFGHEEALKMGLVSDVYEDKEALLKAAFVVAQEIANNEESAVTGTKHILNYMQNNGVKDGLTEIALWNSAFFSIEAVQRSLEKPKK